MKRVGWAILAILLCSGNQSSTAYGIETAPSSTIQTKINGPLLITGYSFTGHSLRYVQIYNSSDDVVSLDGWRVSLEYAVATSQIYAALAGNIAPDKYITVANNSTVPTATFTFTDPNMAADPAPSSISLLAPVSSNFNNEVAIPSMSVSTPRVAGTPATFYFARNVSSSTGNFLTTYTAFVPGANFSIASDGLYQPPALPELSFVEIYPDAKSCSPFETDPTCADYVKLQNRSNASIDLSLFRVRTGQYGSSSSTSNTTRMQGILQAGHYVSFPLSLSASGSWVWLEDTYGTIRYDSTALNYPSSTGHDNEAWSSDAQTVWQWTPHPTPGDMTNTLAPPVTVNQCAGLVISEIAANVATEDQYVELHNPTNASIDLTGCALQTNRSSSTQFVFGPEHLEPGGYRTVYIKDTELTLTKTTTGAVYVLSSDLQNEAATASYENLNQDTAWANIDGNWVQTYALTPDADNTWVQYPACDSGYSRNIETGLCIKSVEATVGATDCGIGKERNPDTNRCRNSTAPSTTAQCDAGQYRSVETNRCRAIVSTASFLTPCASDQERNPQTNRCRSISASTEPKPCAVNQERNPATNRCRNKVSSATTTDFPVQAVTQSGEATLGWWAFGGVGTLAAGYAGWEWRREVIVMIKKASEFISRRF